MRPAILVVALALAPVAQAGQYDGFGFRSETSLVTAYGGRRDGVRAWRRNAYGVDLDFRASALFGPEVVHFGAGMRVGVGIGGQFTEEPVNGLWSNLVGEGTLQVGVGSEESHLVLEFGPFYRRDAVMGESAGGPHSAGPALMLRLRGRASGPGASLEWARGRHVGGSLELPIDDHGHWWLVVRPEYVRYGFRVDEGVHPTVGTRGFKFAVGVLASL